MCFFLFPIFDDTQTLEELQNFRARNAKKTVYAFCPIDGGRGRTAAGGSNGAGASSPLPRRLWQSLALAAGVEAGDKWADVSKKKLSALARQLTACDLQVGRSFVGCFALFFLPFFFCLTRV